MSVFYDHTVRVADKRVNWLEGYLFHLFCYLLPPSTHICQRVLPQRALCANLFLYLCMFCFMFMLCSVIFLSGSSDHSVLITSFASICL